MMTLRGEEKSPMHVLTKEEEKNLPKDAKVVSYTDEEFLSANLKKPRTSAEAVRDMMMLFQMVKGGRNIFAMYIIMYIVIDIMRIVKTKIKNRGG